MRLLLDTNVVLDVLLKREPWVGDAIKIWQAHEQRRITAYIMASALTDIFYIAHRSVDLESAHAAVGACLATFEICPVDRQALQEAQALVGNDFEDNLQIACASLMHVDAIVTRDPSGFADSPVPVITPAEVVAQLV